MDSGGVRKVVLQTLLLPPPRLVAEVTNQLNLKKLYMKVILKTGLKIAKSKVLVVFVLLLPQWKDLRIGLLKIPFRKNTSEKSAPSAEFHVSWNSPFQDSQWNGTGRNSTKKCFLIVIHVFFFVLEWFGTSFQTFCLLLNNLKRISECSEWFRMKLQSSECFSLLQNG
jgi:hypothetical protein